VSETVNGDLAAAIASEAEIAQEAATVRGDAEDLTPALFMQLYPLLCEPIPAAFIQKLPATKGKPYESTGIRSVQVQIDRMNNVLTPLWWWDKDEYEDGGKLAEVTVYVGNPADPGHPLTERSSRGGVAQGSGAGNIYKGSYTNAAKLAFARLGPGHEVYLGATDLDPDVDADLANAEPEKKVGPSTIGSAIAKKLVDRAWQIKAAKAQFQLAASHAADRDVGPAGSTKAAVKAIEGLTFGQAEKLDRWVSKKEEADTVEAKPKAGDNE